MLCCSLYNLNKIDIRHTYLYNNTIVQNKTIVFLTHIFLVGLTHFLKISLFFYKTIQQYALSDKRII